MAYVPVATDKNDVLVESRHELNDLPLVGNFFRHTTFGFSLREIYFGVFVITWLVILAWFATSLSQSFWDAKCDQDDRFFKFSPHIAGPHHRIGFAPSKEYIVRFAERSFYFSVILVGLAVLSILFHAIKRRGIRYTLFTDMELYDNFTTLTIIEFVVIAYITFNFGVLVGIIDIFAILDFTFVGVAFAIMGFMINHMNRFEHEGGLKKNVDVDYYYTSRVREIQLSPLVVQFLFWCYMVVVQTIQFADLPNDAKHGFIIALYIFLQIYYLLYFLTTAAYYLHLNKGWTRAAFSPLLSYLFQDIVGELTDNIPIIDRVTISPYYFAIVRYVLVNIVLIITFVLTLTETCSLKYTANWV